MTKLEKIYVGTIVDIEDPKKEWRIKVDAKGLFSTPDGSSSIPTEDLPWIYPSLHGFDSGYTPKIGQKVLVEFDGDVRTGRYRSIDILSEDLKTLISEDYEGFKSIVHDKEEDLQISYSRNKGVEIILGTSHVRIEKEGIIRLSFSDSQRVVEMNPSGVSIVSDKIFVGSLDDSAEPCVLGDKNGEQLEAIWDAINTINNNLKAFGDMQETVSKSALSPLKPGFKKLSVDSSSQKSPNNDWKGKVKDTKSKVSKLD